jgi:hypothetical protein
MPVRIRPSIPLALLLVAAAAACFTRFHEIRAVETAQGLAFDLTEVESGLRRGRAYELLDLTVTRRDCDDDCTAWLLVRETARVGETNLASPRIVFGVEPEGMEERTGPGDLAAGRYAVAATVQQYDASGELTDSLSMQGSFSLELDASGERRLAGGPEEGADDE